MSVMLARLTRLTAGPPAADGPLLDAFLAGDQNAFAVLVHRHARLVFATCRRILRHQQDAEDAFQATFLVLARRASDVWPREAVASWLFGVAHRVALKARATRGRRTMREQPIQDFAREETTGPDFDLVEAVHRVICKLPEVYRAAVVACDLEGLSRKEAAERLGWSEGTLSGRLARARELLAKRFRQLGLTLPAGGMVAFTTTSTVSATVIQSTIALATGTAGTAPAAVAVLTEGVTRSMMLFKMKAMTAVLAACAIGFGVLAASSAGSGNGDQPGAKQTQPEDTPLAPVSANPVEPAKPTQQVAKPVSDQDLFQGIWHIVSFTEGDKTTKTNPDQWVMKVNGTVLQMPYQEGGTGWKQREYRFTLEPAKQRPDSIEHPNTIDLIASNSQISRGIYEFTVGFNACTTCHKLNTANLKPNDASPNSWRASELCDPGRKALTKSDYGLRLALSADGKRPKEFGGAGVIVFNLKRPDTATTLKVEKVEGDAISELKRLAATVKLAQLESEVAKRELTVAEVAIAEARRNYELSQARWAKANQHWQEAVRQFEQAKEQIEKKVPVAPGGFAPVGEVFTIHVRTLTAAEKVIRVRTTGKETVLEGLVYAADDVSIKSDAVSVWVVRDKAILPVDLLAITKNGDPKTNHVLKVGDQLFVQAKAGK